LFELVSTLGFTVRTVIFLVSKGTKTFGRMILAVIVTKIAALRDLQKFNAVTQKSAYYIKN